MERIGSQVRATLEEEGYQLLSLSADGEEAVLENEGGGIEHWVLRDDFAGFVFEIDGQGYEFCWAE